MTGKLRFMAITHLWADGDATPLVSESVDFPAADGGRTFHLGGVTIGRNAAGDLVSNLDATETTKQRKRKRRPT